MQEQPNQKELKVVNSALGDLGPKSAAQVNPMPGKNNQTLAKTKMHGAFKLLSLATGQLFGDEDVIGERPRQTTATCVSHTGSVFKIDATDFFRQIEAKEESKIEVRKQLYTKEMHIKSRCDMIEAVYSIKPADIIARVALENVNKVKFTEEDADG